MTKRVLWAYWEMAPGTAELPPHIALCREIMERRAIGYDFRLVTPANVRSLLPDLPRRINRITLNPRGRLEKYFGWRERKARAIAQRADYIRAFLLERYGGLYIDSDAIIIGDLAPIFEAVEQTGFAICRRNSFGKSHVSVGLYGSIANGQIIREYCDALRRRIAGPLNYNWNEVGAEMLTPIVDRHVGDVSEIPEKIVQPVTWEAADEIFSSTELQFSEVAPNESAVFMLYSGPFRRSLAGVDRDELISSDRLVSKAFRRGLEIDS